MRSFRRAIDLVLIVTCLVVVVPAGGAEPVRIGVLTDSWGLPAAAAGLRDGLKALGYRENVDFVIGVRFTQGDASALPDAANELVRNGADLLFVEDVAPAKAAQRATSQIPIILGGVGDPIGLGLIQSFARPGKNITGVTDLDFELGPKRLEVFREMVPTLRRVLFPYSAGDPYSLAEAKAYRAAAQRLGITLVEMPLRTQDEAQALLARLRKGEVEGILAPNASSLNIPGFVLEATSKRTIPTMFGASFWVERGGLASYGPDYHETGRQAARLVEKILKGALPGTVPVEVNRKVEFVINAGVARALGLTIPDAPLYRATRIIQ